MKLINAISLINLKVANESMIRFQFNVNKEQIL